MSTPADDTNVVKPAVAKPVPPSPKNVHSSPAQERENWHIFTRQFEGSSKLPEQLQVSVLERRLRISWKGKLEEIDLPEDAFTKIVEPTLNHDELTVKIARRDPNGPAMLEKKALDPDFPHPRSFDVKVLDKKLVRPPDVMGHGQPTPAQSELREHTTNEALLSPLDNVIMPDAGIAASVVTDNPVLVNKGGVLEAPSAGETVVRDLRSADTVRHTQAKSTQQREGFETQGDRKDVPQGMAAAMTESAEPTVVVQGSRDRVLQAEHGSETDSYTRTARAALGLGVRQDDDLTGGPTTTTTSAIVHPESKRIAKEPAGEHEYAEGEGEEYSDEYEDYSDYEEEEGEEGAEGYGAGAEEFVDSRGIKHKEVDFQTEKVGLATHAVTAAERMPRADDGTHEPISSLKQKVLEEGVMCDICECNPCQCDKITMHHEPAFEMTGPETKHEAARKPKHGRNRGHKHEKLRTNRRSAASPPHSQVQSHIHQRMAFYNHEPEARLHAEATGDEPRVGVSGTRTAPTSEDRESAMPKPKGSGYTGGRIIGAVEDLSLNSGRHKPPHVLG